MLRSAPLPDRIVALIASATEIVHSLGLGDRQVGRSHECDYPPEVRLLPVCTAPSFAVDGSSAEIDRLVKQQLTTAASLYEVFPEVLESLQPTHIITQTQCKVCAVSLEDVELALAGSISSRPKVIALEPNSLADIWRDVDRVARAFGIEATGAKLIASLQARMARIEELAQNETNRPKVACIEWHQPLMAAGNWVPELVAMANATNLFGEAGRHSPWMTWEDLAAADPDVIITMPCGFDLMRTREEMHWLTANPVWPSLRAVRNGQIFLADGNQFMNRPGPRVVESLQILAEILHPGAFTPTMEHLGWERMLPVPKR